MKPIDWKAAEENATEVIRLFIPGEPIPQPRQRHRLARTPDGKLHVQTYTPAVDVVNGYKAAVRLHFLVTGGQRFADYAGPVAIRAAFVFSRPGRLVWKRKPMPPRPHLARPDTDNLQKSTFDALKGAAWRDDAQIYAVEAVKRYAAGGEATGAHVEIYYLADEAAPLNGAH